MKELGLAIKIVVVLVIALAWLAFFGNLFYRSVTEGWELTTTRLYDPRKSKPEDSPTFRVKY